MAKRKMAAPKTVTARTKSGKARRGGRWQAVAGKEIAAKPKARALPGMEDHAIPELEAVAVEYAEIRDQRMELTKQESDLKSSAMKAMKKHGKTIYKHGGVTIQIVSGEDDVKVRVKKAGDDDEDEDGAEFSERKAAVESDNGAETGHHYAKRGRRAPAEAVAPHVEPTASDDGDPMTDLAAAEPGDAAQE